MKWEAMSWSQVCSRTYCSYVEPQPQPALFVCVSTYYTPLRRATKEQEVALKQRTETANTRRDDNTSTAVHNAHNAGAGEILYLATQDHKDDCACHVTWATVSARRLHSANTQYQLKRTSNHPTRDFSLAGPSHKDPVHGDRPQRGARIHKEVHPTRPLASGRDRRSLAYPFQHARLPRPQYFEDSAIRWAATASSSVSSVRWPEGPLRVPSGSYSSCRPADSEARVAP